MRQILNVRVDPNTRQLVFLVAESAEVDKLPTCQFCSVEAKYDGKTKTGPWAYMCEPHLRVYGVGVGLGKGQLLKKQARDTSYDNERPSPTLIRKFLEANRP